ncbi:MAG: lipoprotein signal peptidase [Tannerellaceae bacterium]|jgi:signal peptidase II|nr:lipoprotein signal peptidase [Tannerellaceae bacterium]
MKSVKGWGAVSIVVLFLTLDQTLKIWIKTHMQLHESIEIAPWFYIYFTENPGMAFGIEIISKLFLTLFRIVAVSFLAYYLHKIIKDNYKTCYIACIALIFAGAIGNIVDSVFYGVVFDHSSGQVATFMPEGGGYASWLHGKVVDMFYFPLINTTLPDWLPIWGGQDFIFFRPIFNLADSAICVGVFILFIFYRHTLSKSFSKEEEEKEKNADKTV